MTPFRSRRTHRLTASAALFLCVVVVMCSCTASSPPAQPHPSPSQQALSPVSYWQQKYDADLAAHVDDYDRLSRSPDSWDFYTLAYSFDEMTNMFEATGDRSYVTRALSYVENMIASARVSRTLPTSGFKDGFSGWVSNENGETGDEVALYESYCWRYIARLLRVMHDSGLADAPGYQERYSRILGFAETDIFGKWYSRGADDYIYASRTHTAAHWASIALDLSRLTTDDGARTRYLEVVRAIDGALPNHPSSLHGQLRPSSEVPQAYWWSDVWGRTSGPAQDVSHGNGVIAYVVEAHDVGSAEWTDEDIARFARTLTAFVRGTNGRYPAYVDGSGTGNGWIADGFVKLGRYDRAVQAMLQDHGVQNMQYYAAMALNARRLGAGSPPGGR